MAASVTTAEGLIEFVQIHLVGRPADLLQEFW